MEQLNDTSQSAFRQILEREEINRYRLEYAYTKHVIRLDLGQSQDYTAISVIRQIDSKIEVIHLERMSLGTSYPSVVRHVKSLLNNPKLKGKSTLVVDYTGCGRPVVDTIRDQGLSCEAVSITSGNKVNQETDAKGKILHNWTVPKVDLVSVLQVLMQNKKLEIAKGLQFAPVLARELKSFKAKISQSGHVSYEAAASWREIEHDDLVLATALGCWFATKRSSPKIPQRMVTSISRLPGYTVKKGTKTSQKVRSSVFYNLMH